MFDTRLRIATAFHRKTEGSVSAQGRREGVEEGCPASVESTQGVGQDERVANSGVEGAGGERMGEDGAWTRVQRADTVRLCFLTVSSSCPGSFGVTESAEHGAKPWQKPLF